MYCNKWVGTPYGGKIIKKGSNYYLFKNVRPSRQFSRKLETSLVFICIFHFQTAWVRTFFKICTLFGKSFFKVRFLRIVWQKVGLVYGFKL